MSDERCDLICIDAPRAESIRESLILEESAREASDRARALSDPTRLTLAAAWGAAGTDVALETADVALMQDDLPKLAEAVRLSRAAEGIIKQNVAVSIAIKGLFVLLAPFGLVALWLAVLADMGTSIAVTLNGLRLFDRSRTGS
jgi:Zn2+/Cd2+-exporting ATPase